MISDQPSPVARCRREMWTLLLLVLPAAAMEVLTCQPGPDIGTAHCECLHTEQDDTGPDTEVTSHSVSQEKCFCKVFDKKYSVFS